MSSQPVLVILTNWKRQQNMPRIIQAWKEQTAPTHVIVVDNSPPDLVPTGYKDREVYPSLRLPRADDVWRIGNNLGPVCRFAPALMLFQQFEWCAFGDDDLIPGSRAVETCLEVARENPSFSTLGHYSRNFQRLGSSKMQYQYGNVPQKESQQGLVAVDLTIRVHFCPIYAAQTAMRFRAIIASYYNNDPEVIRLLTIHDDFLLSLGGQFRDLQEIAYNPPTPSYILPLGEDKERWLIKESLDRGTEEALWKRPNHLQERQRMVDLSLSVGWTSLVGA